MESDIILKEYQDVISMAYAAKAMANDKCEQLLIFFNVYIGIKNRIREREYQQLEENCDRCF